MVQTTSKDSAQFSLNLAVPNGRCMSDTSTIFLTDNSNVVTVIYLVLSCRSAEFNLSMQHADSDREEVERRAVYWIEGANLSPRLRPMETERIGTYGG